MRSQVIARERTEKTCRSKVGVKTSEILVETP